MVTRRKIREGHMLSLFQSKGVFFNLVQGRVMSFVFDEKSVFLSVLELVAY
jgi:hypothetical protein